jgi:cytochrome c oxidase subunit 3
MSIQNRSNFQGHPFHLVSPSPWPLFTCISLLTLTTSLVSNMHGFEGSIVWLPATLVLLIASMSFWFRDVISEGTYLGNHTLAVQKGLNMGVAMFIISEALFFLAIFWAYFHSALSPTVELGASWPPIGIEAINAFELPLLNTVLLLASGITVTYAHHCLIQGDRNGALYGGLFTTILAIVFTIFQGVEYSVSSFTISDGAFGSCFYFGTGLIQAPIIYTNNNTSKISSL